jgi:hypothetical protein
MSQAVESELSIDDYQRIEANQLGTPLGIYKLKPGYIRIMRKLSLSLILFLISFVLITLTIISSIRWYQDQKDSYIEFLFFAHSHFAAWLAGASSLLFGMLILRVEMPRAQKEHVIVCEQGLLQIGKDFRGKDVDAVRWRDIQAIRKTFFGQEFSITHAGSETLIFSFYKDLDELIALIRQQSEVA